jgi:hypothetical protein
MFKVKAMIAAAQPCLLRCVDPRRASTGSDGKITFMTTAGESYPSTSGDEWQMFKPSPSRERKVVSFSEFLPWHEFRIATQTAV